MTTLYNILNNLSYKIPVILLLIVSLGAGCATNSGAIRKEQISEFNKSIEEKTVRAISPDKTYDLESCIDIALKNSLDIKIAEINGRLANIDRKIAFSYFLPQIDVKFTYTDANKLQMRYAYGTYMAMSDQKTRVGIIEGQLAIFNPEVWFMYSAYRKGEDIQDLVTLRVKQVIRLQVTALYLSCLSLDSNIVAMKASVDQAQVLSKETEALYREGLILKSDLEKARVFFKLQENNLSEAKRQKTYAKSELLEVMGLSPISNINLGNPPPLSIIDKDLPNIIYSAMLNRPELIIADKNLAAQGDSVKMAISAFLPKIFLVGDFTSNRDSFLKYRDILTYGVSGIMTIFDGFANIYEYKSAKQKKLKTFLEREQSCMKIILEAIKAKQSLDDAKDLRDLLTIQLKSSESQFKEVTSLWEEGMMTSSEKLDAVSGYETAKANMSMADYRYQVAAATLADVMGITGKENQSEK